MGVTVTTNKDDPNKIDVGIAIPRQLKVGWSMDTIVDMTQPQEEDRFIIRCLNKAFESYTEPEFDGTIPVVTGVFKQDAFLVHALERFGVKATQTRNDFGYKWSAEVVNKQKYSWFIMQWS